MNDIRRLKVLLGIGRMNVFMLLQFAGLAIVSSVSAVLAIWAILRIERRAGRRSAVVAETPTPVLSFLFENEHLIDATEAARTLLDGAPTDRSDWDRFLEVIAVNYPQFARQIETLPETHTFELAGPNDGDWLEAHWRTGLIRISLHRGHTRKTEVTVEPDLYAAMELELETLRATAESAPFLVWRQRNDGTITWANNAYLDMSRRTDPDALVPSWPPAHIFVAPKLKNMDGEPQSQRLTIHLPGEAEPRWFECTETPLGGESLFTAIHADRIVASELALRDFMQTLTKTFAHLKTGLAIFDKQRRLALFNPALTDLTSLAPDFLSGRPTLYAVLDRLRDKRMIPEQRDYKSWRLRLSELEVAAQNGTYEETWSLPTGQTYRVTGHPHPDGALAFLMEDISAEISLTRRFRMELETGQAVLDSLDEAVAVFSAAGTLTLSNAQYARLWGTEPSQTVANADIIDATRLWSAQCSPTPVWGDAREFIGNLGERAEWTADVRLADGRNLCCRFAPLAGGGTLAGFTLSQAVFVRPTEKPNVELVPDLDTATL